MCFFRDSQPESHNQQHVFTTLTEMCEAINCEQHGAGRLTAPSWLLNSTQSEKSEVFYVKVFVFLVSESCF